MVTFRGSWEIPFALVDRQYNDWGGRLDGGRCCAIHAGGGVIGGLDKGGLIVIIVVSVIAVVAFVWIFHETGKRD